MHLGRLPGCDGMVFGVNSFIELEWVRVKLKSEGFALQMCRVVIVLICLDFDEPTSLCGGATAETTSVSGK